LELLQRYGCNVYQGYLFSGPLPREAFEALLADQAFPFLPR
jgi:EAL domain-containing protein (putative c-di-GMP-specific phosphodiesterase class I)